MDEKQTIIFIVGPTSSGKSTVAVCLAEKIGGEIISCDSMQVYKDMDVITRPPSEELLSRVPHHLVKIISPEEEFSAMRFVELAVPLIESILARSKTPIIAGGTGLYVKALVDGIFDAPPKDEELRDELERESSEKGGDFLHAKLEKIDPETASKLHPNDVRRVIRALEVYELTGSTISEKKTESEGEGIGNKYCCNFFALEMPRELLYQRVELAVDEMFSEGLIDEVDRVRKHPRSLTAGKALGIKEVSDLLDGKISRVEAEEELKKNTRRYAKRQLTWFRGDERVVWVNANRGAEQIADDIAGRI